MTFFIVCCITLTMQRKRYVISGSDFALPQIGA